MCRSKSAVICVCRSNADRMAGAVCDVREATGVMGELWPSGVCLQGLASNRPEWHWLKTVVVSIGGNDRLIRPVRYGLGRRVQANHRSGVEIALEDIKTRGRKYPWDKSIGEPAYWMGGVRRRGGVSSIRAHPWNCGNSDRDAKRKDQVKKSKVESIEARYEDVGVDGGADGRSRRKFALNYRTTPGSEAQFGPTLRRSAG